MHVSGPPSPGRPAAGPVLRRAEHRVYEGPSALARHPALRPFLVDLTTRSGLAVRDDVIERGQSYPEMALPLIESVTSADAPVDLLVVAYGGHDVQPIRTFPLYLASRCPGNPLAFAVTDQGTGAAFAALRLIREHVVTGRCARALLVVAEQAALPYPQAAPAPLPDRHAAAVLLFESDVDAPPALVRQHPGVPAEAAGAVLAADLAELAGDHPDVTLVAGADVDVAPSLAPELRRAPAGLPFTGPWSRLAEPGSLLVLADHDPTLDLLSVASFAARPTRRRLGDLSHQPAVAEQEEVKADGGEVTLAN
jgi:hypothetical protein